MSTTHPVQQILDTEEQAESLLREEKMKADARIEKEKEKADGIREESRKKTKEEISQKLQEEKTKAQENFRKKSIENGEMLSKMRSAFESRHSEAASKLVKSFLHLFLKK
ncbi:hypothetical protein IPN35_03375 [Candidatus Peregrinibacteria bacterium]|nr:MAG: hypothetical protein IPN35_03375 [Candidatus Peregrinibacteria bacterium]